MHARVAVVLLAGIGVAAQPALAQDSVRCVPQGTMAKVLSRPDTPVDVREWASTVRSCAFGVVLSADLTGDRRVDHVLRGSNGSSHGFYFVVAGATHRVILASRYMTFGGYAVRRGRLVETAPTFRRNDASSDPTGPTVTTVFRWSAASQRLVPASRTVTPFRESRG